MYVMWRSSGGRGEYEISHPFESEPPVQAEDLLDHELCYRFGSYGFKRTANVLRPVEGKKRIRLIDQNRFIHGVRQVQAALLLPEPRRSSVGFVGGRPTIVFKRYVVRRMNFGSVRLSGNIAQIELSTLDLYNGSQEESLDFAQRMAEVESIHRNRDKFPADIAALLGEHQDLLKSVEPIPERAEKIVGLLMERMQDAAADFNVDYVAGGDVLSPLKEIAAVPPIDTPEQIDLIAPEDIELRRREVAIWRKQAARGPEGALFRKKVREAYNSTCVVCGIRLPRSDRCRVPGVDSAHILPWRQYDQEEVSNGLCLCKMHHWAFDQQLISIASKENAKYVVSVTQKARDAFDAATVAQLEAFAGEIPVARLPPNPVHWPRPQFLAELDELVGESND